MALSDRSRCLGSSVTIWLAVLKYDGGDYCAELSLESRVSIGYYASVLRLLIILELNSRLP